LPENILSNKSITSVESIINASASYFPAWMPYAFLQTTKYEIMI
jgi:hypothetical protein